MTKVFFRRKIFIIFSFLFFASAFTKYPYRLYAASDEKNWVIAAEKFEFNKTGDDTDSVKTAIQEMIPSRIIENLSSSSYRTISGDEEFERTLYTLKNERISLFLQLSSAIRAKDSIFLNDYSEKKIKSLQKAEDKKIKEVQDKIDANLEAQKDAFETAQKKSNQKNTSAVKTEGQKYLQLIKGLVSAEDLSLSNELVTVYEKGDTNLYTPSETAKENGYKSHAFEKEMVNAKINSLITGNISILGDYMAVTVEVFLYPGCKSVGVVTEVGSLNDVDFLSTSIAHQITPWISASMPVAIRLNLKPDDAVKSLRFSIDDIVYRTLQDEYVVDAGVHSLRFDAEGYKTAITSFNFEGNTVYDIDVELQEQKSGTLFIKMRQPVAGDIYSNGEFEQGVDEANSIAKIKINDTIILGQFIASEGGSGFFYVPEKLIAENIALDVNVKTFDRSEHIDKRRKIMYTSYSVFVVSLIGYIFTNGSVENYYAAYEKNPEDIEIIKKANSWIRASNVLGGLTIATGGFFAFELYRYFRAADSVLPTKSKVTNEEIVFSDINWNQELEKTEEAEETAGTEEVDLQENEIQEIEVEEIEED